MAEGVAVVGIATALASSVLDSSKAIKNFKDAPVDLVELANQVQSFASVFTFMRSHSVQGNAQVLRRATECLSEIDALMRRHVSLDRPGRMKVMARFKWVIKDKEKVTSLVRELSDCTSIIGLWVATQNMTARHQPHAAHLPEIIIAVVGVTGAGKSHFIQQVTGEKEIIVGHELSSKTQTVQAVSIAIENRLVTLVDTPGFDDAYRTDKEVFADIVEWLKLTYESRKLLSGIVYLHPITRTRITKSSATSLDVFASLVGPDSLHNISLVTTMWDLLNDDITGEKRERELHETFWNDLIQKGSITARFSGNRGSALLVLRRIAFDQRMASTSGAALNIQKEMVDERKSLEATSAAEALTHRLDEMEHRYSKQLMEIEQKNVEGKKQMQVEIDRLNGEQTRLLALQIPQNEQGKAEQKISSIIARVQVAMGAEKLLNIEASPPDNLKTRGSRETYQIAKGFRTFAMLFCEEAQRKTIQFVRGLLRPRLQEAFSRIEWTCACGEILYGDYIEKTPGSLQRLARQLGGQIISGPARNFAGSRDNSPPSTPIQARVRGESSTAIASSTAGLQSRANLHDQIITEPAAVAGTSNTANWQNIAPTKWLELCIRSATDLYILGEIDVAGKQTDQTVFQMIREKYKSSKASVRLFGRCDLRVPNGGVFVQFRKDKLATTTGNPATASVMTRPSVPSPQEAHEYHYIFNPVPMDEPPMDTRTFNHYLRKPHSADSEEAWVKRFPQLLDSSLYYGNEKLAKGWGIEITEKLNMLLLCSTALITLLISGTVAGLYSVFGNDRQTGVAIGAWLTAVQALIAASLFWYWENS